jgi:small subunit ribosomal protein S4
VHFILSFFGFILKAMSRYSGPRLRIVRRIGKLRGFTRKKPFRRVFKGRGPLRGKVIPPGQHGLAKLLKSKASDYLIRLKIKQRLRYNYGLTESQLIKYVRKAKRVQESTGQVLLQFLEMRLDNVVFRLNFAPTIPAARQMITHGHIRVNNKKVNIPSYICKAKDVISVAMKERSLKLVNRNQTEYYNQMTTARRYMESTLIYILVKNKLVSNYQAALQLIQQGAVRVNNRIVKKPNFVCRSRSTIQIKSNTEAKTSK